MFCPNCGNQIADDATFCGNCGTTIDQPAAEAPAGNPILNIEKAVEVPGLGKLTFNIFNIVPAALALLSLIFWFVKTIKISVFGFSQGFSLAYYLKADGKVLVTILAVILFLAAAVIEFIPVVKDKKFVPEGVQGFAGLWAIIWLFVALSQTEGLGSFTFIGILFIILNLAAIGFAGFKIYKALKK